MRFRTRAVLLILCLGLAPLARAAEPLSPQQIITRTENLLRGVRSSQGEMEMTVLKKTWTRTLRFRYWEKGRDRTLILIIAPPREKGVATLKIKSEIWNYLPAIERIIKIPPSMMGNSWMGSHFTNDDLVRESSISRDYTAAFRNAPESKDAYALTLTPKPDAAVVWARIDIDIDRKSFTPLKAVYYNDRGEAVRTLTYTDHRRVGDRVFPFRWILVPHNKPGERTEMRVLNIAFDVPIDDRLFTLRALKRLKP